MDMKVYELCQLLKFPANQLFEPDLRTPAAILCLLSSTLPLPDHLLVSRAPDPGLQLTPPSKPTEQEVA